MTTIRQCPEIGCGEVFTDTADLVTHRNTSHPVHTMLKTGAPKRARKRPVSRSGVTSGPDMATSRPVVFQRGRCEADGLHAEGCPGAMTADNVGQFVAHHIQPRSRNGTDAVDNLILVYNGLTGLAAGACHGKIHQQSRRARALGLLSYGPNDPLCHSTPTGWRGIGITAATRLGYIAA